MLDIESMIKLLDTYNNESLSTQRFCDEYIKLFAAIESGEIDRNLFHILEDLFEDIDSYSPMWTPKDEAEYPYRITESTLKSEVQKGLLELEEYLLAGPSIQKDGPTENS